jgi:acetyl-CoA carboxylase biotin carboxyl carrier protein
VAPFVQPGDQVSAGQQLAIIEVMKLMVPVEAECSGTVLEFAVEDGQAVQFGQVLLTVRPQAGPGEGGR